MSHTILEEIILGMQEIFPDTEDVEMPPDLTLGELPEWDSMAVVNLQTYLESAFQIKVPEEFLGEETTLEEVAAIVMNPQSAGLTI